MSSPNSPRKRQRLASDEQQSGGTSAEEPDESPESAAAAIVMRLEHILENIASNLPPTELRSLRSTSFLWNKAFIPSLRNKHSPIRLANATADKLRAESIHWWKGAGVAPPAFVGLPLTEFNSVMKKSTQIPFSDYQLLLDSPFDQVVDPMLEEFVTICGSSARSVSIEKRTWTAQLNLDRIRTLVFDQLPNLNALALQLVEVREPSRDTSSLARQSQKLTQLTLKSKVNQAVIRGDPLLQGYRRLLSDLTRGLVGLKTLVLHSRFRAYLPILRDNGPWLGILNRLELGDLDTGRYPAAQDLVVLNEMAPNIRLQEFSLTIRLNRTMTRVQSHFANQLYDFLVAQSASLRVLEIKAGSIQQDDETARRNRVRLPVLGSLREFRIFLRKGDTIHRFLHFDAENGSSGTMKDSFPSLQKFGYLNNSLITDGAQYQYEEVLTDALLDMDVLGHEGVTSLDLNLNLYSPMDELYALSRLQAGFSFVTNLVLFMSVETVRGSLASIWSAWPLLETASIKFHNQNRLSSVGQDVELDEPLSGVRVPSSASRRSQLLSNLTTLDSVRSRLLKHQSGPGLSGMSRLWKLVFDFTEADSSPTLGDVGGYFGLALAGEQRLGQVVILLKKSTDLPLNPGSSVSTIRFEATKISTSVSLECEALIRSAMGSGAELSL